MNKLLNKPLFVSFECGGKIKLNPAWNTKNVICPENKLFYITDGELIVETENAKYIGKKGDMMIIPAELKHSFYLTDKHYAEKYWMHFQLKTGSENYFENFTVPLKITVGKNEYAEKTFSALLTETESDEPSAKLKAAALVLALVSFYTENCIVTETGRVGDEIEKVITYIKSNYGENPTLKDLTKLANLSPNYLVRKFKKRTGYSPMRYITMIKIEVARFMLENTADTVSDIMEKVGFYDSAHFSKTFKLQTGYSPRNYREVYGNRPFNTKAAANRNFKAR